MKHLSVACGFALVTLLFLSSVSASAQTKNKRGNTKRQTTGQTKSKNTDPFGNPVKESGTNQGANNTQNNSTQTNFDPFSSGSSGNDPFKSNKPSQARDTGGYGGITLQPGVPIVVTRPEGDPMSDSLGVFLRSETIVDNSNSMILDRATLEYEHIREDDAVYRQKIWRVIDCREKMNLPFVYDAQESTGYQQFFAILAGIIRDSANGITVFEDDKFNKPLSRQEFNNKTSGGVDTVPQTDPLNPDILLKYVVAYNRFPIDLFNKYQIMEEVVFDKESSRLFTRILGIAPMGPGVINGKPIANSEESPLFWVYYPDIRSHLSKYKAYNPKNMAARMTWEDIFESRFFSSYIVKSSMDNPGNRRLKEIYENPLFRLYEGENIKEKIFDYEQNLWSY